MSGGAVFDIAIVGLGVMGASALYQLAKRGHRVIGIEQATPGHEGGSSHGESRMIRSAYYENAAYVPLVRHAFAGWRALEQEAGETLLIQTGALEFGRPGSRLISGILQAAETHGLTHEVFSGSEAMARFPAFRMPEDWTAVFHPEAGIVRADRALVNLVALATRYGATVRTNSAIRAIDSTSAAVMLRTQDGDTIAARAVIVAAGAWTGRLVPVLKPHLRVTRQLLGWFAPADPALVQASRCPAYSIDLGDDLVYGFPDFEGRGVVKAASHWTGGALASPDDARQDGQPAELAGLGEVLERHVPGAAGPVCQVKTCLYTHTPDGDFLLDLHPADPRIVLASPCSGHGFKFAPVIGEILADLATRRETAFDIARFRLARLASAA